MKDRILLYALLTSLTGFTLDTVLPVIAAISETLPNTLGEGKDNAPLIMTLVIFGMVFGELIFGPVSDRYGRKPAILGGLALFAIGTFCIVFARTIEWVLVGRVLQGIGVSGPKIGTRAMIRDQFNGPDMAAILSLIFGVLIIVPMFAPLAGKIIGDQFGWRGVFWFLMALAALAASWLTISQKETWPQSARQSFSLELLLRNIAHITTHRQVMCYTAIAGLAFAAQLYFLSVAGLIFDKSFGRADQLAFWFSLLAGAMACGSLANNRLVKKIAMARLVFYAAVAMAIVGGAMIILSALDDTAHFVLFLIAMMVVFCAIGIVFGNINAMAMQYLGQVAGVGASVIASLSSFIAFSTAYTIGTIKIETLTVLYLLIFFVGILIAILLNIARIK